MLTQKNTFLIFLFLPGISSLKGWEGIITLFHRGEHHKSEVKTIISFHLRIIFFSAFLIVFCCWFFFLLFAIILKDLCEVFILGIDLESYSYKRRPRGILLVLGMRVGI